MTPHVTGALAPELVDHWHIEGADPTVSVPGTARLAGASGRGAVGTYRCPMSSTATSPSDKVQAAGTLVHKKPGWLGVHTLWFALGRVIWHSSSKQPWPSQGAVGTEAPGEGLGSGGIDAARRARALPAVLREALSSRQVPSAWRCCRWDTGLLVISSCSTGSAAWHESRCRETRGRLGTCLPTSCL